MFQSKGGIFGRHFTNAFLGCFSGTFFDVEAMFPKNYPKMPGVESTCGFIPMLQFFKTAFVFSEQPLKLHLLKPNP